MNKIPLREWLLIGAVDSRGETQKIYTSPEAPRSIALKKMEHKIPPEFRCFVKLQKGKIV